jgi:hypothetical protein
MVRSSSVIVSSEMGSNCYRGWRALYLLFSLFRGRPNSLTALVGGGARYLVDYHRKAAIARD